MAGINLGPIIGDCSLDEFYRGKAGSLKIAHLNAQSLCPSDRSHKLDVLANLFSGKALDIICVTETWLNQTISDQALEIPGYSLCRCDRPIGTRGGGVAIYIAKGIEYKVIYRSCELFTCEGLFISILTQSNTLCIGAVYLPRGDLGTFESTFNDIFVRFSNIIIVGDFNNNLFDASKSADLHLLCRRYDMVCRHNFLPTHYDPFHQSTSLIDYFLTSQDLLLDSSAQYQIPLISYHSLICAAFSISIVYSEGVKYYRDFNRADLSAIEQHIAMTDFSGLYLSHCPDEQLYLLECLFNELLAYIPFVRSRGSSSTVRPKFTNDINYFRSLTNIALRAFYRNRSESNWEIYSRLRNATKSKIRKFRRNYSCRFFRGRDSRQMWSSLHRAGVSERGIVACDLNVDEINDRFINSQLSCHVGEPDFTQFVDTGFSFSNVTEVTLLDAMHKIKSTAVGADDISLRLIRIAYPFINMHILHFFNCILTTSCFPSIWKIARIIPIPKSGRQLKVDNMRPISILSALSKIFEVIMKDQMLRWIEVRGLLNESQYGFRSGHSTADLLNELTDTIRNNFNYGRLSVLISVDLSKAFDRVNPCLLVHKLNEYFRFSRSACRLFWSYLSDRKQFVTLNDVNSAIGLVRSGVPQGSVIGPLLFTLFLNDMFDKLLFARAFVFADDIQLLWSGHSRSNHSLQSAINADLSNMEVWMNTNYLLVNTDKTKAMIFGANRAENNFIFTMANEPIGVVSSMKCLGLIIDEDLSFRPHIDSICSRVSSTLRRLYHLNLFLPLHVRKCVAHALLMSQVNYCIGVYSGCNLGNRSKIRTIVNLVVRYVYGIRPWGHVSSYLKSFLNITFESYLKFRLLIYLYNIVKLQRPANIVRLITFSRSVRNPQILIPAIRNALFERSFIVRAARLWNVLPIELRCFAFSTGSFRRKLLFFFNGTS